MNYRTFANLPFQVSEIGFGCSRLADNSRSRNDGDCILTLLHAFDHGVNFFDTADVYAQGDCERLLGRAFKNSRSKVIIATKAGYKLGAGSVAAALKPLIKPLLRSVSGTKAYLKSTLQEQCFSPRYIREAIERSLRRLQSDYIDVFQFHNPPREIIQRGEFLQATEVARRQGKIRCCGISCRTIEDAQFCLQHPSVACIQVPINLLQFGDAVPLLSLAKQKAVGVIARQPLASGYLARPVATLRPEYFSCTSEEFKQNLEKARTCQFLQLENRRTLAQAAIRFVLEFSAVSVVIVGMRSARHVDENIMAARCALMPEELTRIMAQWSATVGELT